LAQGDIALIFLNTFSSMYSNSSSHLLTLQSLAEVRTPFKDKFGIPRQASLLDDFEAQIIMHEPFNTLDAFRGIESFSHLWLSFIFHKNDTQWRPLIRPPRLGGNQKIGVFASRSSFRPNRLGLSLVKFKKIEKNGKNVVLTTSCPDLIDQTPIVDIRPYVAYSDHAPNSQCGYAQHEPEARLKVSYSTQAQQQIERLSTHYPNNLKRLIETSLRYDPRPAYKQAKQDQRVYHIRLYDVEISFSITQQSANIITLKTV